MTGSTRLLKDSRGAKPLTFIKVAANGQFVGLNSEQRGNRTIEIADFDETSTYERHEAGLTVIHEIGHNWDSGDERAAAGIPAATWRNFAAISQWRPKQGMGSAYVVSGDGTAAHAKSASDGFFGYPQKTADGREVRYGRFNVFEDFATSFEERFRRAWGTRTADPHRLTGKAESTEISVAGAQVAAAKLASVESLVRAL